MPLLLDIIAALVAGLLAFLGARLYAHSDLPAEPAREVARTVGEAVRPHAGLRGLLSRRLDRTVATGFLLTAGVLVTVLGGLVLGVLAVLVRRVNAIQHVDNSVAAWGNDHRTSESTAGLKLITQLGNIRLVVVFALLLVLAEVVRGRGRAVFLFVLTALLGMELISTGVKDLVGRLRPTLNPAAEHLGPSFASGHSAAAATFYAAAALIVGRRVVNRTARHALIALAVAIAIAVAGSRVLLDLHWFSDVIGGLSLGWAWFALCAIAFGGRLLRPTAAAETAAAEAARPARGRRRAVAR
jgi:membrane-associated phospholipid phosphatase